jgi:DNA-binding response OmpR family regulator
VIIIVSNSSREASSLALLTANHPRPTSTCTSAGQFKTQLMKNPPAVVITRTVLVDGYSDDILALLRESGLLPGTRVIVLAGADCTSRQETRQLSLGADCVLRDPVRSDVLLEYTTKYLRASIAPGTNRLSSEPLTLAGATIRPDQQKLVRGRRSVHVTPKEIELARLLAGSPGKFVTYHFFYSELFNRTFSGDSANLRVLFGILVASYRKLGLDLRSVIRVTPKSGYCYLPSPTERRATKPPG